VLGACPKTTKEVVYCKPGIGDERNTETFVMHEEKNAKGGIQAKHRVKS
jgi:hypothetical protein